ncbi:MAG: choice-of-anchor Q domain-containing protein [Limisphaerales bacterium]
MLRDCQPVTQRRGIAYGTANKSLISGNQANSGAGAYLGALNNCLIKNNVATAAGGGAYQGTLNNCTLTGNSSNLGGGAYQGALNNCISYYNIVGGGSNYFGGTLNYCCTSPAPANGAGNFTNAPLFINLTNNFQLQSHSLCINAGRNSYVVITNDLDGSPRIVGGTVDIGAYEYQTPASVISYAWLQQYGLPMDGSADFVDSDNDRMDNREEWMAGTIPTNAASVLQLASPLNSVSGMTVTWQSVTNVTYYLQTSTNLPAFYSIQSNLVAKPARPAISTRPQPTAAPISTASACNKLWRLHGCLDVT